jgi:large subunit ribosomal protein L11
MASIKGITRIRVPAGIAKPAPALGQALGPLGVNMMEFCKDFNAKTANYKNSAIMRVKLTAFEDRTFKYIIMAPDNTWYLKRVTGVTKGAGNTGKETVGQVSLKALYEIALSKKKFDPFQKPLPLESIVKCLVGSARAMGLKIVR